MGEKKVASALEEIWQLAHEGRGQLLLVENGYRIPATVDDSAFR